MGFPKLLLARQGLLLLRTMTENLRQTGWGGITIVVSNEELGQFVNRELPDVVTLFNATPETGMIDSIRLVLSAADQQASGILTLPVDHPLIQKATLARLRQEIETGEVVIPTYRNRRGHPTWWSRSVWDRLLSDQADQGAKQILRDPGVTVREIPVADPFILENINTPDDLKRWDLERFMGEDLGSDVIPEEDAVQELPVCQRVVEILRQPRKQESSPEPIA